MNPYQWIITQTVAKKLQRVCQECGNRQQVPADRRQESVPCARCGRSVPPPREGSR